MDVYQAIEARRSVRAWRDEPVDPEVLQRVLNAAVQAPTARNRQEWKLVVVRDADLREQIAAAADQPFVGQAPVLLAIVGLTPTDAMHCHVPTDPVDCAIVLDHVTLAAVAEGLGTCWIGHFDQDKTRRLLGVPDSARIIELMPLGWPQPGKRDSARKGAEELICYDAFEA